MPSRSPRHVLHRTASRMRRAVRLVRRRPGSVATMLMLMGGSLLGGEASGALDGLGAADEGAIVIIPVLAVFGAVLAALFGAGWLLLLYFGSEALLAAAVELAFAYTAARTVVRVEREGWLLASIRLSWKPLLGALVCAVALGALIDHFVPQAETLAEAVRLWRASR